MSKLLTTIESKFGYRNPFVYLANMVFASMNHNVIFTYCPSDDGRHPIDDSVIPDNPVLKK
jgi:hypothetical protein